VAVVAAPANRKLFLEAAALDTLLDLLTDANNMVQLEATNAFRTLVYVRKGELMDFEAPVIRRILSMPSPSSATEFQLSIRAKYGDDVMSFIGTRASERLAPVPFRRAKPHSAMGRYSAHTGRARRRAGGGRGRCSSAGLCYIPSELDRVESIGAAVHRGQRATDIGRIQVRTAAHQAHQCRVRLGSLLGQVRRCCCIARALSKPRCIAPHG